MKAFSKDYTFRGVNEIDVIITYKDPKGANILLTESNDKIQTEQLDFIATETGDYKVNLDETLKLRRYFNTDLFKSVCKCVEMETKDNIKKNTQVKIHIGVKINNDYEYVSIGRYYVYEGEYQPDSENYLITLYDKMYLTMVPYDESKINISYPISVENLLIKICNYLEIKYKFENLINGTKLINKDVFKGLGLTFRDILDNICQVCVCNLIIDEDEMMNKNIKNSSDFTLTEEELKNVNVEIKEKFGPVDMLSITTNEIEINSIGESGVKIQIDDNYILLNDSDTFINDMYNAIKGLEYYLYDVDTVGIVVLDPVDRFNIKIGNNIYSTLFMNSELNIELGILENCYAEEPEIICNEYKNTNKIKNKLNNAVIEINKANAQIILKVDSSGRITQVKLGANADDGSVFDVKADNIKLEGYTTINGGFKVDLEGNVICNNATIKGSEVILSDNTQIIGGNGLLTNLQFMSTNVNWLNKLPGMYFLGYNFAVSAGAFKNWLEIDCVIPKNFTITEAYVNVYHTPINWSGTRGYCRNVKLYKVFGALNAIINGAYLSEYDATYNYTEIDTNALNFTANGTASGEIVTSSDIKSQLSEGFNKFTIHTSDSVPSASASDNLNQKLGAYTGYCYAVLNVIGFKK